MTVSAEVLRTHIDYTAWASRRLVDAASRLSPDELTHDFQTADRSIQDTLVHTFAADRIWFYRLAGGENPGFISESDRRLEVLQYDWPRLHDRWKAWAGGLTNEHISATVSY